MSLQYKINERFQRRGVELLNVTLSVSLLAMNQKHVCQASSEMKLISQESLKVNISSGAASSQFS